MNSAPSRLGVQAKFRLLLCGSFSHELFLRPFAFRSWSLRVALVLSFRSLALRAVHVWGVSNILADGLSLFIHLSME